MANIRDLYGKATIIKYPEGDESLHRKKIIHFEDLDDKAYVVKDGDTLTGIAYKFYNEPLYWYLIADVNNIDNPLFLETGRNLVIPNLNRYEL